MDKIWIVYGDDMEQVKWSLILLYWVWLANRNMRSKNRDWRLYVQIVINLAVIAVLVIERRMV